jgi:hypothetical protein
MRIYSKIKAPHGFESVASILENLLPSISLVLVVYNICASDFSLLRICFQNRLTFQL